MACSMGSKKLKSRSPISHPRCSRRVKYIKTSTEYEKTGGTRTDERKSPKKKSKLVPATA